jgi:hypothetical protein
MNLLKIAKHTVELFIIVFIGFLAYMFVGPAHVKSAVSAVGRVEVRPTLYAGPDPFLPNYGRTVSGIKPTRLR